MENLFKPYLSYTEPEIKAIWDNCTFSFDTNVLLNLYRYSNSTSGEIIDILKRVEDRVFLPYHVGFEFHRKRPFILLDQIKVHEDFISNLEKTYKELADSTKAPHISDELLAEARKVFDKIRAEINGDKQKITAYKQGNDSILKEIYKIFDGKVGKEYDSTKLEQVYAEGKKRFEKKVPPGYADNTREKEKSNNVYGDYIIWLQLIEHADASQKPLIFISEDQKEDWYWKTDSGSTTIGMRPELRIEMLDKAKVNFQIYTIDQFLKYAKSYFGLELGKNVIEEVEKVSKYAEINFDNFFEKINAKKFIVSVYIDNKIEYEKLFNIVNDLQSVFVLDKPCLIRKSARNDQYIIEFETQFFNDLKKIPDFLESIGIEISSITTEYIQ